MTLVGVIFNASGPIKYYGSYSPSNSRADLITCDPKCISIDLIDYSEFRLQMSKYDVALVVCQLANHSESNRTVERLKYLSPKMDTYVFVDMHKLFAEQPMVTASYTYAGATEQQFTANLIYYTRLPNVYEEVSVGELPYNLPSDLYIKVNNIYQRVTSTEYEYNQTYYRLKHVYEVVNLINPDLHTPDEYYIFDEENNTFIKSEETIFDSNKSYYESINDEYKLVPIVGTKIPSNIVLYHQYTNPQIVTNWNQLSAYLNGLESDILSKYLTTSLVPNIWTSEKTTSSGYKLSTDTSVKTGKRYYTRTGYVPTNYVYTQVATPSGNPSTKNYYEETTEVVDVKKETPFYSNIQTQIKIRSVENTHGLEVEYGKQSAPYKRRTPQPAIEYGTGETTNYYGGVLTDYPDLVIRNISVEDTIDLDNSIPIVNGSVFYPSTFNNLETHQKELFALQAGKWVQHSAWNQGRFLTAPHVAVPTSKLFHTNKEIDPGNGLGFYEAGIYNKNIMLLDFSSIGTIDTIPLSQCKNGAVYGRETISHAYTSIANRKDDPKHAWISGDSRYPRTITSDQCSYLTIEFDLPANTTPGIPIVVICGRLFFLNEHVTQQTINNTIHLSVKIDKALFVNILTSNLQWYGKQINDTQNLLESIIDPTLDQLFVDDTYNNGTPDDVYRWLYEDLSVPYVIMLHSNTRVLFSHIKPRMTIGPDKFLFPPNVGGILMNTATREIIDYARTMYASSTMVTTTMIRPFNKIDNGFQKLTTPNLYYENLSYAKKSKYMKFYPSHTQRDIDQYELIDIAYVE